MSRILVVDDEASIREMLSRHFRFQEKEVVTAGDGIEAMDILKNQKVDIILCDITMPRMDGVELLRHIRAEYPMIRTIMMTGYVTQGNVLACMRHGADTCVFKPFDDLSELEEAVQRADEYLNRWKQKFEQLVVMKQEYATS